MNALSQQLPSVALDLVKLCVWLVLLAVIFVPLELLFPARRRRILRRGFWSDIGYYFLNNYLAPILMIPPIALLGWALHFLVPAQVYVSKWLQSFAQFPPRPPGRRHHHSTNALSRRFGRAGVHRRW